jgi:hypothetical protein
MTRQRWRVIARCNGVPRIEYGVRHSDRSTHLEKDYGIRIYSRVP